LCFYSLANYYEQVVMAYNQQQSGYGSYPSNPSSYQPQAQNPGWNVGGAQSAPHYAEGGIPKSEMGFNDKTIRAAFVRKVFFMVMIMLAVVAVMSAVPYLHPPTMTFVRGNLGLYYLGYITFLVVYIALMCCEGVRRSFPANIICTAILTLSIGYMTMVICSVHRLESVALALVITTLCCGAIIVFSSQTKYDLTSMMGIVFIISMVLMIFGLVAIMAMMFFNITFLYTVYAGLAALLFMFYLAIDVQMIMGGRQMEISPEDHIFAAIQVFLDIIYIFWMLLSLLGNKYVF
jgi:FtsH-binding integral membrane protein